MKPDAKQIEIMNRLTDKIQDAINEAEDATVSSVMTSLSMVILEYATATGVTEDQVMRTFQKIYAIRNRETRH